MKTRSLLATLLPLLLAASALAAGPFQSKYPGPMVGDDLGETAQKTLALFTQPARVNSSAPEASHVLKATGGSLVSLFGYNTGTSGFIQVFDSATVPADGATPVAVFAVAAAGPGVGNFSLDVPLVGIPFANGIVVVYSTTAPTKTAGAASVLFTAVVR